MMERSGTERNERTTTKEEREDRNRFSLMIAKHTASNHQDRNVPLEEVEIREGPVRQEKRNDNKQAQATTHIHPSIGMTSLVEC